MLSVPDAPYFSFKTDNYGSNPAATFGTQITHGTSNGEGTYAQVIAASALTQDISAIMLQIHTQSGTGARTLLVDIGVDPAGGTAWQTVVANLVCGQCPAVTATGGGHRFLFPLQVKAGSAIAVRGQSATVTSGTFYAAMRVYGQPSAPHVMPTGMYSETIGAITNSGGVSFTPGNAGDGSWASLGTTTRDLWWWQICYQVDNGTVTAEYTYVDIAFGDANNKQIINRILHGGTTAETSSDFLGSNLNAFAAYCPVPAGSTIYIRGRCNNSPDTGYNGVAVGIG